MTTRKSRHGRNSTQTKVVIPIDTLKYAWAASADVWMSSGRMQGGLKFSLIISGVIYRLKSTKHVKSNW